MDESVDEVVVEAEDKPTVIQFRDVTAAAYRIKKGVKETPLEVGGYGWLLLGIGERLQNHKPQSWNELVVSQPKPLLGGGNPTAWAIARP